MSTTVVALSADGVWHLWCRVLQSTDAVVCSGLAAIVLAGVAGVLAVEEMDLGHFDDFWNILVNIPPPALHHPTSTTALAASHRPPALH